MLPPTKTTKSRLRTTHALETASNQVLIKLEVLTEAAAQQSSAATNTAHQHGYRMLHEWRPSKGLPFVDFEHGAHNETATSSGCCSARPGWTLHPGYTVARMATNIVQAAKVEGRDGCSSAYSFASGPACGASSGPGPAAAARLVQPTKSYSYQIRACAPPANEPPPSYLAQHQPCTTERAHQREHQHGKTTSPKCS
jgi:hypothetical protein